VKWSLGVIAVGFLAGAVGRVMAEALLASCGWLEEPKNDHLRAVATGVARGITSGLIIVAVLFFSYKAGLIP
jgi:H+/Cl- antiporter ClcA